MAQTLYERLGGEDGVLLAVNIFYRKVLTDPRVNYFFKGVDMDKLIEQQKGFLTMAFGGPKHTGKSVRETHHHLLKEGLNDTHVDIILEHLENTLKELGVDADDTKEAVKIANSFRNEVLSRSVMQSVIQNVIRRIKSWR